MPPVVQVLFGSKGAPPVRVGRRARHAAVEIGGAVGPSDGTAFAERNLGLLHRGARGRQRGLVVPLEGGARGGPGVHERRGQAPSFFVGQRRIRAAPEPAAHNEVSLGYGSPPTATMSGKGLAIQRIWPRLPTNSARE